MFIIKYDLTLLCSYVISIKKGILTALNAVLILFNMGKSNVVLNVFMGNR